MNRLAFARRLMSSLARGARKADVMERKRVLAEVKQDVENLWHFLAELRERNVMNSETYESYVKRFMLLRRILAQKEQE